MKKITKCGALVAVFGQNVSGETVVTSQYTEAVREGRVLVLGIGDERVEHGTERVLARRRPDLLPAELQVHVVVLDVCAGIAMRGVDDIAIGRSIVREPAIDASQRAIGIAGAADLDADEVMTDGLAAQLGLAIHDHQCCVTSLLLLKPNRRNSAQECRYGSNQPGGEGQSSTRLFCPLPP